MHNMNRLGAQTFLLPSLQNLSGALCTLAAVPQGFQGFGFTGELERSTEADPLLATVYGFLLTMDI